MLNTGCPFLMASPLIAMVSTTMPSCGLISFDASSCCSIRSPSRFRACSTRVPISRSRFSRSAADSICSTNSFCSMRAGMVDVAFRAQRLLPALLVALARDQAIAQQLLLAFENDP